MISTLRQCVDQCYSHNSEQLCSNISMQWKCTYGYKLIQVDKVADKLSEMIDSEQVYQLYMLYSELSELSNSVIYRNEHFP